MRLLGCAIHPGYIRWRLSRLDNEDVAFPDNERLEALGEQCFLGRNLIITERRAYHLMIEIKGRATDEQRSAFIRVLENEMCRDEIGHAA